MAQGAPGSDWERYAEELLKDGYDEEAVDHFITPYRMEALDGHVWPENELAFRVYISAKKQHIVLPTGAIRCLGIPATETLSACLLHRVPRRLWPEVTTMVEIMCAEALKILNPQDE